MTTNLQRRIERLERIAGSVRNPEQGSVIAILLAARRRLAEDQQCRRWVERTPEYWEDLRRRARDLRQRRDAVFRTQRAVKSERR